MLAARPGRTLAIVVSLLAGFSLPAPAQRLNRPYTDVSELPAPPLGDLILELIDTINAHDPDRAR